MARPGKVPALNAADFERALAARPCARSEHFVLHHARPPEQPLAVELSTPGVSSAGAPVDDGPRLGLVMPKRHAKRAVTRNLIKRQGRAVFALHRARLNAGDWLLRLHSPYSAARFPSAASEALRRCVRGELQGLFASAAS